MPVEEDNEELSFIPLSFFLFITYNLVISAFEGQVVISSTPFMHLFLPS